MAFDSAVMAECFKELMVRQEKTIFGVHDEIMCESEHRDTVRSFMIEAYRKVLKREPVKKKISILRQSRRYYDCCPLKGG